MRYKFAESSRLDYAEKGAIGPFFLCPFRAGVAALSLLARADPFGRRYSNALTELLRDPVVAKSLVRFRASLVNNGACLPCAERGAFSAVLLQPVSQAIRSTTLPCVCPPSDSRCASIASSKGRT